MLLRLSKWEGRLFVNCIAIAIGVGAFVAAVFVSRGFQAFNKWVPGTWRRRFGKSELNRAFGVFAGSYFVLFGARIADVWASCHILGGDLRMALSSIEFFVVVATTLLVSGHIIYGK